MDDLTTNDETAGAAAGLRNLFGRTGRDPFGVEAGTTITVTRSVGTVRVMRTSPLAGA